eukprot:TRINITY_DN6237_c0_g1_i2.p1 TRINITY_DN6237_c0_g1~~TRINITY_DN6237_c0_g1_i2.p1  ORF type:complete len:374 (-),score=72.24 TRINITY_DN6237_c0_g1_i2:3-1124(-)
MAPGQQLVIPGGWISLTTSGTVLYIIERELDDFSFVVCNSGGGLEYHPSTVEVLKNNNPNLAPDTKLKYKTCLRIDHVALERISDVGFWALAFTLWAKNPPSEYHRVEILYDVLLPWIAAGAKNGNKRLLSEALVSTSNDAHCDWRTPQRSNTSSFRSIMDGLRYLLRKAGFSKEHLKQFTYCLRIQYMLAAGQDLIQNINGSGQRKKNPELDSLIEAELSSHPLLKPEEPDGSEGLSLGALLQKFQSENAQLTIINSQAEPVTLSSLQGKTIGIYFSAHWCPPCQQFTPMLIKTYQQLKKNNQPFEIIFVSSDKDIGEWKKYYGSMPWLAIPYSAQNARALLSDFFSVSGIPYSALIPVSYTHLTLPTICSV